MKARFDFAKRFGWTIGESNVSFWFDNWNEKFSYDLMAADDLATEKLRDFWDGEQWNLEELVPILGHELVQYTIERTPTITDSKDVLFWNLSSSGAFFVKSAWESIRHRGRLDRTSWLVWGSPLPSQCKILV